jgi:phage I-like protein
MNLRELRTWHADLDAVATVEFEASGEAKQKWIQIMPSGEPTMNDQQKLRVLDEDMKTLEAGLAKKKDKRIPILFRHGKDLVKGGAAGGWFVNFERRADGLYGLVEWAKGTAQEIRDGLWRFLSPGFWGRADAEGFIRPESIYEVSLTNIPAIHGMRPAEAEQQIDNASSSKNEDFKEEQQMDLKEIALSLGLDETADAAQVKTRIETLKAGEAKRVAMENAAAEAAKPKVYTFTQEQFDVEIAKAAEAKAKADVEAQAKTDKVNALMELGAKDGKVTPENKDAIQKIAEAFPVEFEAAILPALKVVTPVGSKVNRDGSAENAVSLENTPAAFNSDELDTNAACVAKQFGMSIADAKAGLVAGRITVKK